MRRLVWMSVPTTQPALSDTMTTAIASSDSDNYNEGPTVLRTSIAVTVLASLVVALRLWARRIKKLAFGLDDWIILAAMVGYHCTPILSVRDLTNDSLSCTPCWLSTYLVRIGLHNCITTWRLTNEL